MITEFGFYNTVGHFLIASIYWLQIASFFLHSQLIDSQT